MEEGRNRIGFGPFLVNRFVNRWLKSKAAEHSFISRPMGEMVFAVRVCFRGSVVHLAAWNGRFV